MMHNLGQSNRGHQWHALLALGVALACVLTMPAPPSHAQEASDARPALHNLSKVFTQVAQDAMPAVVFIQ